MKYLLICCGAAILLGTFALVIAFGGLKKVRVTGWKRLLPVIAVLAILACDAGFAVHCLMPRETEEIMLTPIQEQPGNLIVSDIKVEGVKRDKTAIAGDGWEKEGRGFVLTDFAAAGPLKLLIPVGEDRQVIMKTGTSGIRFLLTYDEQTDAYSTWADTDGTLSVRIPNSNTQALARLKQRKLICFCLLLVLLDTCFAIGVRCLRRKQGMIRRSQRNGAAELYRFLFAVLIIWYHSQIQEGNRGYMAVGFFFILSGWFLMAHIDRREEHALLPYMRGRLLSVYPLFMLVWLMTLVVNYGTLTENRTLLELIGDDIGELTMTYTLGLPTAYLVPQSWYISAMLVVSAVFYVLLPKHRLMMTHRVLPVLSAVLIGYFCLNGGFGTDKGPLGLFTGNFWTGMAEMSLGCITYDFCLNRPASRSSFSRAWYSVLELLLFSAAGVFIFAAGSEVTWDLVILILLLGLAVSTLHNESMLTELLSNPVSEYLGSLSMPMYLIHVFVMTAVLRIDPELSVMSRFLISTAITMAVSVPARTMIKKFK